MTASPRRPHDAGEFSVTIQAPPEAAWPWVPRLEKHADWSTKPYTVESVSGTPNAVGSRYRSIGSIPTDEHHVNEGEITQSVPNTRFALRADDPEGPFLNTYTLAPRAPERRRSRSRSCSRG